MLLLGSGVMTVALLLHLLANSYLMLIAMRIFAGAAGGMLSGAAVSYIGDCFPYNRRGWATGWVMSGSAFGQIVGIPLGILLAGRWGFNEGAGTNAANSAIGGPAASLPVRLPGEEDLTR